MKFTYGTVTDRGLNPKRAANEDRFLVLYEAGVFLVADGVGGRRGGQVASQTVVDVFSEMFAKQPIPNIALAVEAAVLESNRRIFESSIATRELEGMATTVVVLAADGADAIIGHVGDSRIYRFERGILHRDTDDHSEVGEAVRAGIISPAMAAHDPLRNVLTRAVGAEPDVEPDFKTIPLSQGTRFLLCSDGITRHVTDASLSELLAAPHHPEAICEILKQRCFAAGAEDNLTAVVVDCGEISYQKAPGGESTKEVTAAPLGKRIEVDLSRPSSNPIGKPTDTPTGQESEAGPSTEVAVERVKGRGLRTLILLLVVAAAGVGIGRYYDTIESWVRVNLVEKFFPSEQSDPVTGASPSATDPDLAAARVLFEDKRFEKARDQLIELTRRSPEKAEYHLWLGLTEYQLKNYPEAIKGLNEAARLDPDLPEVYAHLARAYEATGDRRRMEDSLRRQRAK